MARRGRALCVGVNYAGTAAELRGPVNDALHWAEILMQQYDFLPASLLVMIDEYPSGEAVQEGNASGYWPPTKENILQALDWFVSGAVPGDVLVFTFSGHAVQLPDGAAPASARLEEALCPADWGEFEWGTVPQHLVSLDILLKHFARLPGGVLLTVVLDASLMGSPLRLPFRIDSQFPDQEADGVNATHADYRRYCFSGDAWLRSQHVNALPRRLPFELQKPLWSDFVQRCLHGAASSVDEGLAVFCIAACHSGQSALDACLEGVSHGCLSYCLWQALELSSSRCTYSELSKAAGNIAHRLRSGLLPYMDQFSQLSYGKNARPDECFVFDAASALVAQNRAHRRRGQRQRPT